MEYTPQGQLHSSASPGSAYRSLALQRFACWAIAKRQSSLAMHGVMQFARALLSCNGRAESKVPSHLVAFGRALGCIGRSKCWKVMWLPERGYTASVQYSGYRRLPSGSVPSGSKPISRGRWWIQYMYLAPPCSHGASHAGRLGISE